MIETQTIRLFRKKADDLDALVLLEFFKFIGCLVTDFVIEERRKFPEVSPQNYDLNIILNLEEEELQSCCKKSGKGTWIKGNTLDEIFNEILKIKKPELNSDSMKGIIEIFKDKKLPVVLYNLGNMKFVHEYYPQKEKWEKVAKIREEAFQKSYDAVLERYNKLEKLRETTKAQEMEVHFEYAVLNMKYTINQILYLWKDTLVFDVKALCAIAEKIRQAASDFVRLEYLTGFICIHDNRYLIDGETHFMYALQKAGKRQVPEELMDFLYYQLGRFCEKIRKNIELSDTIYEKAYSETRVPFFRALYKKIKEQERKENWNNMIDLCNEMIKVVLNGYKREELMPKEQLYIYKTYMMLGLAFYKLGEFDLAILSYRNAIEMAEVSLNYNKELGCMGYESFVEMAEVSMPRRYAYLKLIECYSKYGDSEAIEECQRKLTELE